MILSVNGDRVPKTLVERGKWLEAGRWKEPEEVAKFMSLKGERRSPEETDPTSQLSLKGHRKNTVLWAGQEVEGMLSEEAFEVFNHW